MEGVLSQWSHFACGSLSRVSPSRLAAVRYKEPELRGGLERRMYGVLWSEVMNGAR